MKNVVVIYKGDDWDKKIPISNELTRKAFESWHELGQKKNINFYRASFDWYDVESNSFKKAWAFRNGKWIKIRKAVIPDMIFDKIAGKYDYELYERKKEVSKKVFIYNSPDFRTLLDSKINQYVIFSDFMAKTYFVESQKEFLENIKNIKTSKIVIKPIYGSGGSGIIITNKEKINLKQIIYPVIIQEFIQTMGIPGISKKGEVADLRIVYINHQIAYALSRIAPRKSLFTNLHQGGTAIIIPKSKIPKSAIRMSNMIIKTLSLFPKANYSLDYLFSRTGKPYLVEMNTTPGFDLLEIVGTKKIKERYFDDFVANLS